MSTTKQVPKTGEDFVRQFSLEDGKKYTALVVEAAKTGITLGWDAPILGIALFAMAKFFLSLDKPLTFITDNPNGTNPETLTPEGLEKVKAATLREAGIE